MLFFLGTKINKELRVFLVSFLGIVFRTQNTCDHVSSQVLLSHGKIRALVLRGLDRESFFALFFAREKRLPEQVTHDVFKPARAGAFFKRLLGNMVQGLVGHDQFYAGFLKDFFILRNGAVFTFAENIY